MFFFIVHGSSSLIILLFFFRILVQSLFQCPSGEPGHVRHVHQASCLYPSAHHLFPLQEHLSQLLQLCLFAGMLLSVLIRGRQSFNLIFYLLGKKFGFSLKMNQESAFYYNSYINFQIFAQESIFLD
jgi:hypothetical protein